MLKENEIQNPKSCLNKANMDERLFVLMARDPVALATIRFWINQRVRLGKNTFNDEQIIEAIECANKMEIEGPGIIK